MGKLSLLALIMHWSSLGFGQQSKSGAAEVAPPPEIFFCIEDTEPEYPGGAMALQKFLNRNLTRQDTRDKRISGTVLLHFVIGVNGRIGDVDVLEDIGGGCGDEAVRAVKMMPEWKPARRHGVLVPYSYTLPVLFK